MQGKALTKEEHEKRMRFYNKGYSDNKIAMCLGLNQATITIWRQKNKLKPNGHKFAEPSEENKANNSLILRNPVASYKTKNIYKER